MIRKAYDQYAVADFLNDDEFLQWVKTPSAEGDAYWEDVIARYPEKKSQLQQARELILLLNRPVDAKHPGEDGRGRVWEQIERAMHEAVPVRSIGYWRRIVVAASVLLLLAVGLYLYRPVTQHRAAPVAGNDVPPGKDVAVLTLANGRKVLLDSTAEGLLAKEGGTSIRKTAAGQLEYLEDDKGAQETEMHMNQMETPKGGQYRLTLPDGTKVWLNAASVIRYPSRFTGGQRLVELNGEAYFEVTANKEMPFRVASASQIVEVLGTHFNINCYVDEGVSRTTLLEGSVKVTDVARKISDILKPGEQSVVSGAPLKKGRVDAEEVMAWKEGYFIWNNENLKSIMRKLARWYNIEPVYEGALPEIALSGLISRSKNLSEVLKVMEMTGSVHFTIEGRRVIVHP